MEVVGNYSFDGFEERVELALAAHRDFIEAQLAAYERRLAARRERGVPTLAILGMGRAGKDTAAEYLCNAAGLTYGGSSSNRLCRFVAHATGLDEGRAFAERHQHREFWKALGNAIRGRDMTLLARITLGDGDFAVGLRGRQEVYCCRRDGVIDAAVWIDNVRVPSDITVDFEAADCDLVIPNHGSHSELYRKLDTLITLLRVWPDR